MEEPAWRTADCLLSGIHHGNKGLRIGGIGGGKVQRVLERPPRLSGGFRAAELGDRVPGMAPP